MIKKTSKCTTVLLWFLLLSYNSPSQSVFRLFGADYASERTTAQHVL